MCMAPELLTCASQIFKGQTEQEFEAAITTNNWIVFFFLQSHLIFFVCLFCFVAGIFLFSFLQTGWSLYERFK